MLIACGLIQVLRMQRTIQTQVMTNSGLFPLVLTRSSVLNGLKEKIQGFQMMYNSIFQKKSERKDVTKKD